MDLKKNYTKHIASAPNLNQGIGGQDESWVSTIQAQILRDNGLMPGDSILELGCGTGRLLLALSEYLSEDASYLGIDLVDSLIDVTKNRIEALNLPKKRFKAQKMVNELDYPKNLKVDFMCAFSVYTHMEPEDIYVSLRQLLSSAHKETIALVTFLPLEYEFGKVNFLREVEHRLVDRYSRVRNVSMTKVQAMEIVRIAGWRTIGHSWQELDQPYNGVHVRTNQSFLVLQPE